MIAKMKFRFSIGLIIASKNISMLVFFTYLMWREYMMTLLNEFNVIKDDLIQISEELYENPELGNEEFNSMQLLIDYLKKHNFSIETGLVNLPTSFRAEFTSGKPGPTVAYLAEYDALPGIGHGCGHNLIAATSIGAGIVLSKLIGE